MQLIFSINLPEKILSHLVFSEELKILSLDISCNRDLSDRDLLNLAIKMKNI